MILGPIVQKYAFGTSWTGIPYGTDITDNKTLVAFIIWLIALVAIFKNKKARLWSLLAALVTLAIFMIPHSMHGSELDYSNFTFLDIKGNMVNNNKAVKTFCKIFYLQHCSPGF
ncbi:MAG: hypothetical protein GXO75_18785 [Calditrichaeota bacterium]|nr:hypothetical protein [Calditrichota bacterium]